QRWGDTTLGELVGLKEPDEDELYAALDWLGERQEQVETALARRHLSAGAVVLYDVTSTYVTGRECPLAAYGYSPDTSGRDREQIVFGLVLDGEGRPLGVEAFAGNTADPATVERQVERLKGRYGLERVVLVGDRGMLTQARIEGLKKRGGIDWISCLRMPAVRSLLEQGAFQLSLFDERDLVEITSPAYPGERLVVCRNPLLREERARKREDLLERTEVALGKVQSRVAGGRLRGAERIGVAVGKVLDRWKMGKHFQLTVSDGQLTFRRDEEKIQAEAALDGLYVVRTNLPEERLDGPGVVEAYKSLSRAERAFRTFKTMDLEVRPIFHYRENRVRAHLFLCLLAAYVQWHLERALAPLLLREEGPVVRENPVAPAPRSAMARSKDRRRQTIDGSGLPVQSLRTLLQHLGTLTKNRIGLRTPPQPGTAASAVHFDQLSIPTPLQARVFELLGFTPASM
ncbi:MAG: IS1634 family transposase, partial [Dehalococcoidia bacterium]